jgi:hypothetical protein
MPQQTPYRNIKASYNEAQEETYLMDERRFQPHTLADTYNGNTAYFMAVIDLIFECC